MTKNTTCRVCFVAVVALCVSAGCLIDESNRDPSGSDVQSESSDVGGEEYDALAGYDSPELEERLRLLRQEHDFEDEGNTCSADASCGAPLRCDEAGTCRFPPALTGQASETTPYVLIEAEASEEPLRYFIEVADNQAEQMRGMMHRQLVSDSFGMLFVFQFESPRSFWMRNTFVPLDIIFIDSDGDIVSISENAEPLTETSRRSEGPAKYVLELAGGESARAGIAAGDHVSIVIPDP